MGGGTWLGAPHARHAGTLGSRAFSGQVVPCKHFIHQTRVSIQDQHTTIWMAGLRTAVFDRFGTWPVPAPSLSAVISEARRKLEGSSLPCGDCGEQVEQLVAARLAACRLREATHAKQQQPATGGRSRRRAAVAAHAAFAVAAAAEEGMEEEAEGTGAAHRKAAAQQQQQQPGSPGSDLENMVGPANQPAGRPAAAGKRSGGTGSLESLGQHKLALQPTQAASGSSKRQRM